MTPLTWVAVAFVAGLIVFFMFIYFQKNMTEAQEKIFRVLSSLCVGFAGGLFVGQASFTMNITRSQGSSLAVGGTAGFALFFAVFYGSRPHSTPKPDDGFNFSVLNGWNFKAAAEAIAKTDSAVATFVGFSDEELATPLRAQELHTETPTKALLALSTLASALPTYQVRFSSPSYTLQVIRNS